MMEEGRSAFKIVVLYGCETWYLTLRGECRLGVFENRILWHIFGLREMRMGSVEGFTLSKFVVCYIHLTIRVIKFGILIRAEWKKVRVLLKL